MEQTTYGRKLIPLTIDRAIKVPEGEERIYENEEIILTADVVASGTLIFRNCLIHGERVAGLQSNAKAGITITGARFENCPSLYVASLIDCDLIYCGEVRVEDGKIRDCRFLRVGSVFASNADVVQCRFTQIRGEGHEDEGVIGLESSEMIYCEFDDVELRGGALLVDATEEGAVSYCTFANCRTDRPDGALCSGFREIGVLRKRLEIIEVVNENNCTGLDCVAILP